MGLDLIQCVQPRTFQPQLALALDLAERIGLLRVDVPGSRVSIVGFFMRHEPAQAAALSRAGH